MDAAIDGKFDQILKFNKYPERFEDENQVVPYLRIVTSYRYCLKMSLHRQWGSEDSPIEEGKFYQIIPDQVDDGFFDWYCNNRAFHQFFQSPEMALLHFLFYRSLWMREKKASAE